MADLQFHKFTFILGFRGFKCSVLPQEGKLPATKISVFSNMDVIYNKIVSTLENLPKIGYYNTSKARFWEFLMHRLKKDFAKDVQRIFEAIVIKCRDCLKKIWIRCASYEHCFG